MTPDEQAFLSSIQEAPEDDAPRLVYADWLEEHDQPQRAEFIRIQCALERLSEGDPQRATLAEREARLLRERGTEWRAGLPDLPGARWEFRRGLIGGLVIDSWQDFEREAEELLAALPITDLTLRRLSSPPPLRLNDNDDLRRLREEAANTRRETIAAIARSRIVARLSALRLSGLYLTDEEAAVLGRSPFLGSLQTLDMSTNSLRGGGVAALVNATGPKLQRLGLYRNRLGAEGAALLASLPAMTQLTWLDVSNNHLNPTGIRTLVTTPAVGKLHTLRVSSNLLEATGAKALASSSHLAGLRALSVGINRIDDVGLRELAESESLAGLTSLDLDLNKIGLVGIRALVKAHQFTQLADLDLSINPLKDAGAKLLAGWECLQEVTSLNLRTTSIGPKGAQALADSPMLSQVAWLDLGNNDLGDAGVQALARSTYLTKLRWLKLASNKIGEAGARALVNAMHLDGLQGLDLWGNGLKGRELRRLQQQFGGRLTV